MSEPQGGRLRVKTAPAVEWSSLLVGVPVLSAVFGSAFVAR